MKKVALGVLIIFVAASLAFAQTEPRKSHLVGPAVNELPIELTWDFSYPEVLSREIIDNESLGNERGLNRSWDFGLRQIAGHYSNYYMSLTLISGLFLGFIDNTFTTSEHEMGHLQAFSRAGISSKHFLFVDSDDRARHISNYFEIWGQVWNDNNGMMGAAVSIDAEGYAKIFSDPALANHSNEFFAVMEAGGLNQAQYSLERINNTILAGKTHILDGIGWFLRLNETLRYNTKMENSDIVDYIADLEALGIHSSVGHVKNIQWLKYLSGSTIAMWTGLYNFANHGDSKIAPPFLFWPEFASYLTTHGPTLKIRSVSREIGNFQLQPSFQFSLDDAKHEEYGLRIESRLTSFARYELEGLLNRTGGHWFNGMLTLSPTSWLDLGLGFSQGRGYTYEREINGKTFWFKDHDELSVKATVAIFFQF